MSAKPFHVRDKRSKGWFYMDNEYLNGLGKHLGAVGVAVYVSLCRHAGEDQSCFPAQQTIARELNIAERTVRKYIDLLKKHRVIEIERVKAGRKWANNLYWLLDKSEWIYPDKVSQAPVASDKKRVSQANNDSVHRHQLPTKDTHKKNTHITTAGTSPAHNLIVDVIDLFVEFNPSCKKYYANRTQRKSVESLLQEHGFEKVKKVIAILPKTNGMSYMPTITTPLQLEDKWASLQSNLEKKKNELQSKKVEVLL